MRTKAISLTAIMLALFSFNLSAAEFGTAFTYQGRLDDGATPANGIYDLRFAIYDASTGGSAAGVALTNAAVGVTNGLFATTLDFGPGVFTGDVRWLDVAVRTNGATAFSTLTPRQVLTATPYAIFASGADNASIAASVPAAGITGSIMPASIASGTISAAMLASNAVSRLSAPDGSPANAVTVNTNGLVGIGTTNPVAGLQIAATGSSMLPNLLSELADGAGYFTRLGGLCSVAVRDTLMAIGSSQDSGVTLVNISDPASPVYQWSVQEGTGSYTNLYGVNDVALSGNLLAIAGFYDDAVTLVDITTPTVPVLRSVIHDGEGLFTGLDGVYALNLTNNLLAIAARLDNAVTLVDVSNPASPVFRATMKDGESGYNNLAGTAGLARRGNLLAIAARTDSAVTLVDISNPASPVLLSSIKDGVGGFTNLNGAYGVAFAGNLLAIAADADNAVTLVDVSNPSVPALLSSVKDGVGGFDFLAGARAAAFQGNTLWIAAYDDHALTAVDVRNPSAPVLLGLAKDGVAGFHLYFPNAIAVAGNTVVAGAAHSVTLLSGTNIAPVGLVSEGWVGIGVSQPQAPLHVQGNVVVDGATLFDINADRLELGSDTVAIGINSTALGAGARASGYAAAALGSGATASGNYATALSWGATAGGEYSTAMGYYTTAGGDYSAALGAQTTASGSCSMAQGYYSTASGSYSTAMGYFTTASGDFSTAMGNSAVAAHAGSFVWADSQIASFSSSSSDQFLIRALGGVGINTNNPNGAALNVNGTVTATAFIGDGGGLTNLAATQLSGTVPLASLSGITSDQISAATWQLATNLNGGRAALATNVVSGISITNAFITNSIFAGNGASLTNLNAGSIASGTVPLANLSGITSSQLDASTWQLATNLNGGRAAVATNVVSGISITNAFITNSIFAGNGGGLTNLNASQMASGTVAFSQLPSALVTNNESGVSLSTLSLSGITSLSSNLVLNDKEILFRLSGDPLHGLGWYGSPKYFGGVNVNGPVLYGNGGGALGAMSGTTNIALQWDASRNVTIGGMLSVSSTLNLSSNLVVNDKEILLRGDANHGLGWYGAGKTFAGTSVDGPVLYGYSGGGLGILRGGTSTNLALYWNNSGNVGIGTNNPAQKLVVVGNIYATGTITPNSDRNLKTDFAPVDAGAVLEKVASLPIQQWRFKAEDSTVKHVGPMAQDFRAAFGLGEIPTAIATVDADGVALAAIQGLNQKLEEQRAENADLKARLEKLEQLLNHRLNGGAK